MSEHRCSSSDTANCDSVHYFQNILSDFKNDLLLAVCAKIEDNDKKIQKLLVNVKSEIVKEICGSEPISDETYSESNQNSCLFEECIENANDYVLRDFFKSAAGNSSSLNSETIEANVNTEDLRFESGVGANVGPDHVAENSRVSQSKSNVVKNNYDKIEILNSNIRFLKDSSDKLHQQIFSFISNKISTNVDTHDIVQNKYLNTDGNKSILSVNADNAIGKSTGAIKKVIGQSTCNSNIKLNKEFISNKISRNVDTHDIVQNKNYLNTDENSILSLNADNAVGKLSGTINKVIGQSTCNSNIIFNEELSADEELQEILKTVASVLNVKYNNEDVRIISKPNSFVIHFRLEEELNKWRESARQKLESQKFSYAELLKLEDINVITNSEKFDCPICFAPYNVGEGITLHECAHSLCRECIINTLIHSNEMEVPCPCGDGNAPCDGIIQQRELKEIVPRDIYNKYLDRNINMYGSKQTNTVFCKTPDCRNFYVIEEYDDVPDFECGVCFSVNCIPCQAVHPNQNCRQYQDELEILAETDDHAKATLRMFRDMIARKEAMHCPKCRTVIMKTEGCDGIRCLMCDTEICWATFGPRWGPRGKGDTTGGCRCTEYKRCHPNCNNCH